MADDPEFTNHLIKNYCEIARIPLDTAAGGGVRILACRVCGSALWNIPLHFRHLHVETYNSAMRDFQRKPDPEVEGALNEV